MDGVAIVLSTALALVTAYYVSFLTRIRLGLSSLHKQARTSSRPLISVLVAARNEEDTIAACVDSLCRQTYPPSLFEVLICDDGSTDRTITIAREAFRAGNSFQVLPSPEGARRGKTSSLERGIAAARGSLIATTDADCVVPTTWLSTLAEHFVPDVAFVAGPVLERSPKSFFEKLEFLEFLGIVTAGAGLIGSGRPVICNGANMAFRRSAFDIAGGYGPPEMANDDEGLMNRIVESRAGRVAFALGTGGLVRTTSNNSPVSFFLQRARWAGKKGRYQDTSIVAMLVFIYFFFVILLVTMIAALWSPILLLPALLVLGGKWIIEYFILRSAAKLLDTPIEVVPFLVAELFHVPYIVITAAAGQVIPSGWKGST